MRNGEQVEVYLISNPSKPEYGELDRLGPDGIEIKQRVHGKSYLEVVFYPMRRVKEVRQRGNSR